MWREITGPRGTPLVLTFFFYLKLTEGLIANF